MGPVAVHDALQDERDHVGRPDRRRDDQHGRDERFPRDAREERRQPDPEESGGTGGRQRDEEPVERRRPMLDDPDEDVAVEVR
jgi:hypothetical protein